MVKLAWRSRGKKKCSLKMSRNNFSIDILNCARLCFRARIKTRFRGSQKATHQGGMVAPRSHQFFGTARMQGGYPEELMKTISSKTQFPTLCRSPWAPFAWNESKTTGRHLPRMLFGIAAILCLCLGFSAAGLHAQGYGTISGTITDSTGAVIASATVTATQPLTGAIRTVETGKDGEYVFPALLPNAYTVSVTAPGLETHLAPV